MPSSTTQEPWVGCYLDQAPCGSICCASGQYCEFNGQCVALSSTTSRTHPTRNTQSTTTHNVTSSTLDTVVDSTPTAAATSGMATPTSKSTLIGAIKSALAEPSSTTDTVPSTITFMAAQPTVVGATNSEIGHHGSSSESTTGIIIGVLLGLLFMIIVGARIKLYGWRFLGPFGTHLLIILGLRPKGKNKRRKRHSEETGGTTTEDSSGWEGRRTRSASPMGREQPRASRQALYEPPQRRAQTRRSRQRNAGEKTQMTATERCQEWVRSWTRSASPMHWAAYSDQLAIHEQILHGPSLPRSPTSRYATNLGLILLSQPDEESHSDVDIVFVHGLTGNSHMTWLHEQSQVHWPTALLGRSLMEEGVGARIFAFGYNANILNVMGPASQNRIGSHAINLVGALAGRRERSTSVSSPIDSVSPPLARTSPTC